MYWPPNLHFSILSFQLPTSGIQETSCCFRSDKCLLDGIKCTLILEREVENILAESTVPHSGLNDFITQSKCCHNFSGFLVTVNKEKKNQNTIYLSSWVSKSWKEQLGHKPTIKNTHKNISDRNHIFWARNCKKWSIGLWKKVFV